MEGTPRIKACGVLIVQGQPIEEFLLMEHNNRLDLPKGHMEEGETEQATALREMQEETGISPEQVVIDDHFRFEAHYDVWPKRFGGRRCHKTTVIFLARLKEPRPDILLTEHVGYRWQPWSPPHQLQAETIDPLLAALARHVGNAHA